MTDPSSGNSDRPTEPLRSDSSLGIEGHSERQGFPEFGSEGLLREGDRIGAFRLVTRIGEGGFGEVWLAERSEPFMQRVALKVVKAGMDSRSVIARFEQERRALALMSHPNIATVLDGGITARGRPYFAMEYVRGQPLVKFCDERRLSTGARLELFLQVCEAVHHAHLKGVIHRDLKPSNILAYATEGPGWALKVIDFGVAKAMHAGLTSQTMFTETGQMVGTLEYMSPEQADLGVGDVDARSDVYSLGVLLYELIAGTLPFQSDQFRNRSHAEVQHVMRDVDPPSPSRRLSTLRSTDRERVEAIERCRGVRVEELRRELQRELEWIPLKAMRKDRRERYQSALDLSRDIQAYLDGRPLTAAPESMAYRARKFVRRNRVLVTAGAAVASAILAGLTFSTWQWYRAEANGRELAMQQRLAVDRRIDAEKAAEDAGRKEREAKVAQELAERSAADAARALAVAREERERATSLEREARAARDATARALYVSAVGNALNAVRDGDRYHYLSEESLLRTLVTEPRFEVDYIAAMADNSISQAHFDGLVNCIELSPDGALAAIADKSASVYICPFDGNSIGEPIRRIPSAHVDSAETWGLAFVPGTTTLVSGGKDGTLCLWDYSNGVKLAGPVRAYPNLVEHVCCSPDGRLIATHGDSGGVFLWDASTLQRIGGGLWTASGFGKQVRFSGDGKRLVAANLAGDLMVWDVSSRAVLLEVRLAGAGAVALDHDGTRAFAAGEDGQVRVWDVATQSLLADQTNLGSGKLARDIVLSPDASLLAMASEDSMVRVFDARTLRQIGEPLRGHVEGVLSARFSRDGKRLVSSSADGGVLLWDVSSPRAIGEPLRIGLGGSNSAALSTSGESLATGERSGAIQVWDTLTGLPLGVAWRAHSGAVNRVGWCPNADVLASLGTEGMLKFWEVDRVMQAAPALGLERGKITAFDFDQSGRWIVVGYDSGAVCLWDWRAHAMTWEASGDSPPIAAVAFSPDGLTTAVGARDGVVRILDAVSGRQRGDAITLPSPTLQSLVFRPDNSMLLCSSGSTIERLDLRTRERLLPPMTGHRYAIRAVSVSPDGRTIASGGADSTVRLWDVDTGRELGVPRTCHSGWLQSVVFSSTGDFLVSACTSGEVYVWDAVSAATRSPLRAKRLALVEQAHGLLHDSLESARADWHELTDLQRQILSDPRYDDELRRAAFIALASPSAGPERAVASMADLRRSFRAIARSPGHPTDRTRNLTQAEFESRLAISRLEQLWSAAHQTANARWSSINCDEACLAALEAELPPDDPTALHMLAEVYWHAGNRPAAVSLEERAIRAATRLGDWPRGHPALDAFVEVMREALVAYRSAVNR